MRPLGVALDSVMEALRSRLGLDAHAIGIDLATDQHLVLGLALDVGAPARFDGFPVGLARGGEADWAIELDPALLVPAIRDRVTALAQGRLPGVHLGGAASVALDPAGLVLGVAGTADASVCGAVPFAATAVAVPLVCGHAIGACGNTHDHPIAVTLSPRDGLQAACVNAGQLLGSIATALQSLAIALFGGAPPSASAPPSCEAITGPLLHDLGGYDVVYPLRLDTRDGFIVAGRSQLMDNLFPGRPAPPLAGCAW